MLAQYPGTTSETALERGNDLHALAGFQPRRLAMEALRAPAHQTSSTASRRSCSAPVQVPINSSFGSAPRISVVGFAGSQP